MTATVIPFRTRAFNPANDNTPEPTPPAAALSYPLIAMQQIERFAAKVAARPNLKPSRNELPLKRADCEYGCDRCFMECAVASDRLAWWEGELAKACGTHAMGRA